MKRVLAMVAVVPLLLVALATPVVAHPHGPYVIEKTGTPGPDVLTGGSGNDWFWFRGTFGRDTITDYSTGERLDVRTTGVTYADLQFTNISGNLEISATAWGAGNVIVLENVIDTSIAESSFLF